MRQTPTQPYHDSALSIIHTVLTTYRELKKQTSLSPSERVNELFTRLVSLSEVFDHKTVNAVFSDTTIQSILPDLRSLCEEGEILLEKYWARKIQQSQYYTLRSFPYYDNYLELTQLEYNTICAVTDKPFSTITYIGSGALPLTSICFAQMYKQYIHNIERDPEAVALSRSLIRHCKLEANITISEGNADTWVDFEKTDIVFLAAMVGYSLDQKQHTLRHLYTHMRPGQLLVIRTTHSLRSLLYPLISPEDIPHFTIKAVMHPYTQVVNSVIIAER